jgi:anti-sigma factor ChrR (cupin superfamily)
MTNALVGLEHPWYEELYAYSRGRLNASEAERLAGHIHACPECSGLVSIIDGLSYAAKHSAEGWAKSNEAHIAESFRFAMSRTAS